MHMSLFWFPTHGLLDGTWRLYQRVAPQPHLYIQWECGRRKTPQMTYSILLPCQPDPQEQEKIKLLLLGAGESGKSTIFKQMKLLYGAGNTLEDKKMMTPVVFSNTISTMRVLIEQAKNFGYDSEVRMHTPRGRRLRGFPPHGNRDAGARGEEGGRL